MALEWLKTILGDQYTDDVDAKVSAEIGKAFVSKVDFDTKNGALKTAKEDLKAANETIDGFKSMDIESIKKAASDWKEKAEKAEQDAANQIAEIQFNTRLDAVIAAQDRKSVV